MSCVGLFPGGSEIETEQRRIESSAERSRRLSPTSLETPESRVHRRQVVSRGVNQTGSTKENRRGKFNRINFTRFSSKEA